MLQACAMSSMTMSLIASKKIPYNARTITRQPYDLYQGNCPFNASNNQYMKLNTHTHADACMVHQTPNVRYCLNSQVITGSLPRGDSLCLDQ